MENLISVCCVCKKIKYNGEWVERQIPKGYTPTHTYCPTCYEQALKDYEQAAEKIDKDRKLSSKLEKSK